MFDTVQRTIEQVQGIVFETALQPVLFRPNLPKTVWIYDHTTDGRGEKFTAGRGFRGITKIKAEK